MKLRKGASSVDVIVPIKRLALNWTDFFDNWFGELPIDRLFVGDAGHNKMAITERYPVVTVLDQSGYQSLAYCIQELIDHVRSDWFVYLHGDVMLNPDWFLEMEKFQGMYDWFESKCTLVYPDAQRVVMEDQFMKHRAYSGAQMGRTECFRNLRRLDDDYGYRCEDLIFQEWIEEAGFKYGKVPSASHSHFVNPKDDDVVAVAKDMIAAHIKYLNPVKKENVRVLNSNVRKLRKLGYWNFNEWIDLFNAYPKWIPKLEPAWKSHVVNAYLKVMG